MENLIKILIAYVKGEDFVEKNEVIWNKDYFRKPGVL
jgi:hypothetical protein